MERYGAQPEDLVIGWAKQLCDALTYLHSQKPPIIYRDMKPANVMLKPEGNIKIIDFGNNMIFKPIRTYNCILFLSKGKHDSFEYHVMNKCQNIKPSLYSIKFNSMNIDNLDSNGWK